MREEIGSGRARFHIFTSENPSPRQRSPPRRERSSAVRESWSFHASLPHFEHVLKMPRTSRRGSVGRRSKGSTKNAEQTAHNAARRVPGTAPVSRPRADTAPLERTRKRTAQVAAAQDRKRQRVNDPKTRSAIEVLYHNMGSPERKQWAGRGGTVSRIKSQLQLKCDARKITRTLESIAEAKAADAAFDPRAASVRGGQKRKLSQVECEIAADQLARGTGLGQTLFNVNDLRRAAGKSEVSRTTLRDSVKRVLGAKRQKTRSAARPEG